MNNETDSFIRVYDFVYEGVKELEDKGVFAKGKYDFLAKEQLARNIHLLLIATKSKIVSINERI